MVTMKRRDFLAALAASSLAGRALRATSQEPRWRRFEITTRIDLSGVRGPARAWVPLALTSPAPFQSSRGHRVGGNASRTRVEAAGGAAILSAEWDDSVAAVLEVTLRVDTAGHRVDFLAPSPAPRPANLSRYLRPTTLIPLDGIVRETADSITGGHRAPLSRARAIYDWIVEHTVRDPEVKGCGVGDIRWMLESKSLRGKCADLNALFVGLARASGLPARDLYGIRVAASTRFPSLGRAGGDVTTAQHCRAEVFVEPHGWIPVDPADVRKLIVEERAGVPAPLADPYVRQAREALFGSWEMNWIAFNDAHDVALPGAAGKPLPFLMYPQAEADGMRRDSLDPERFRYKITAREL
jgi:transglutaminase-like putative cysteine protease